jgi:hypothetical protein
LNPRPQPARHILVALAADERNFKSHLVRFY